MYVRNVQVMKAAILAAMMDKLSKRKFKLQKENHLNNRIYSISYNHEHLFRLYERSIRKTKNIDSYIDNMDESDKVLYEENIVKEVQKFKG